MHVRIQLTIAVANKSGLPGHARSRSCLCYLLLSVSRSLSTLAVVSMQYFRFFEQTVSYACSQLGIASFPGSPAGERKIFRNRMLERGLGMRLAWSACQCCIYRHCAIITVSTYSVMEGSAVRHLRESKFQLDTWEAIWQVVYSLTTTWTSKLSSSLIVHVWFNHNHKLCNVNVRTCTHVHAEEGVARTIIA